MARARDGTSRGRKPARTTFRWSFTRLAAMSCAQAAACAGALGWSCCSQLRLHSLLRGYFKALASERLARASMSLPCVTSTFTALYTQS